MIRAAILCRVSTEAQRDNTSLPEQRRILTALCEAQGWAYEVFDEVESGGIGIANRPILAQILGRIVAGEFARLVVLVPDRLTRAGVGELEQISATLARVGARLVTQAGESDPRNLDHVLVADVQAVIAKNERLRTRERTIRGREAVARAGAFTGHQIPFGWVRVWQPDGSSIIAIDELAASVVRGLYGAYAGGSVGATVLASGLNTQGLTLHGRPWNAVAIRRILASQLYQGVQAWRGNRRTHATDLPHFAVASQAFPAIVSPALWQACAAARWRRALPGKPRSSGDWPLTHILRCRECSGGMATSVTGAKAAGGPYHYYRCPAPRSACAGSGLIRADVAHRVVFDAIPGALAWAAALPIALPDEDPDAELAALAARLAACDRQEADLWRQKQAGMDEAQWRRLNGLALEDRAQAEAAMHATQRRRARPEALVLEVGMELDPAWLDDRATLRELFGSVFTSVVLWPHGGAARRGTPGPLQAHWRVGRAILIDGSVWR